MELMFIIRDLCRTSNLVKISLLSLVLLQSACTSTSNTTKNIDPFEPINRPIYKFNDITDRYLLRPLGQGYNFILPQPVRNGVGNFYDNITYPVTIVNGFLQGKFEQGTRDTVRFIANSTFGILGFFDVASRGDLERHDEDLGQTFARWGIPQGPYIVIPLLGPSTVRDGIGIFGNVQVNPLIQMSNTSVRDKLLILWYIESRAALIGPDEVIRDAFDPYLFIRDAYLQNRQFLINDSTTPVDDFFEDDFEDEFGEEFDEEF
jgi:phospholipid-binding lipoprotein MlaA